MRAELLVNTFLLNMSNLSDKTILVTGGAGFVGSHMCDRLLSEGARVICFDNLSTGKKENIVEAKKNPNFIFVQGDANVLDDIRPVFLEEKVDYVFHYAATVGVKRVWEEPFRVLRDIDGIKNILDLSLMRGVKKVMYSSSSEAYGELTGDLSEDGVHNPNTRDVYALTKLIGENLFLGYFEKYKLPAVALRFFNVYGPRQESSDYGFVVGVFIRQILDGKPPTVFGDGSQTRDFVYVADNIDISLCALMSDKANGKVINIGKGKPTTILELANTLADISGSNMKPEMLPDRPNDILYRSPDTTRMKEILGAEPSVELAEGLKKTFDWYKENVSD
jgi:UDP-glucuronate decarboxylase